LYARREYIQIYACDDDLIPKRDDKVVIEALSLRHMIGSVLPVLNPAWLFDALMAGSPKLEALDTQEIAAP
jgi:hypothetical protein